MTLTSRASILAGVVDEHEIFRRGVVACLEAEAGIEVVEHETQSVRGAQLDVAVVSARAVAGESFGCPVLVCASRVTTSAPHPVPNDIKGVLPRATLTAPQLVGAVRAAAAGLAVRLDDSTPSVPLGERSIDVLRLLAEGADTQQISEELACSSRTVKAVISDLERNLGVRNRAHAVAVGIRDGLI